MILGNPLTYFYQNWGDGYPKKNTHWNQFVNFQPSSIGFYIETPKMSMYMKQWLYDWKLLAYLTSLVKYVFVSDL